MSIYSDSTVQSTMRWGRSGGEAYRGQISTTFACEWTPRAARTRADRKLDGRELSMTESASTVARDESEILAATGCGEARNWGWNA